MKMIKMLLHQWLIGILKILLTNFQHSWNAFWAQAQESRESKIF
jgi:hypothetical protein